jgi:hypothetical protein
VTWWPGGSTLEDIPVRPIRMVSTRSLLMGEQCTIFAWYVRTHSAYGLCLNRKEVSRMFSFVAWCQVHYKFKGYSDHVRDRSVRSI